MKHNFDKEKTDTFTKLRIDILLRVIMFEIVEIGIKLADRILFHCRIICPSITHSHRSNLRGWQQNAPLTLQQVSVRRIFHLHLSSLPPHLRMPTEKHIYPPSNDRQAHPTRVTVNAAAPRNWHEQTLRNINPFVLQKKPPTYFLSTFFFPR